MVSAKPTLAGVTIAWKEVRDAHIQGGTYLMGRRQRFFPEIPLFYFGVLLILAGGALYFFGMLVTAASWLAALESPLQWGQNLLAYSQWPAGFGLLLVAIDLALMLPAKRRIERRIDAPLVTNYEATVALTAFNDQDSIEAAVSDFRAHPRVRRVLVVDNNSLDETALRAGRAGAIVIREAQPGYGRCVFRCLAEAFRYEDTSLIVLCEGDRTFRAGDLEKLFAYAPHADIVNGTRIVEQLRASQTQLGTFMFYGNFFAGKLLEVKHLGRGTFTDVGTTYKVIHRDALARLLPLLDPAVNLEFNAHLMDTALANRFLMVECPVTFHARVGASKGGNVNNWRALKTGLRMILGLTLGWKLLRSASQDSSARGASA